MNKREELIKVFEISQKHYHFFHNALWENEKHFTWWISIFIGAIFVIFTSDKLEGSLRNILIITLSILGLFVSIIGYRVIRKESIYFQESKESFNRIAMALKYDEACWDLGDPDRKWELIKVGKKEVGKEEIKIRPVRFEEYEEKANKSKVELIIYIFSGFGLFDCKDKMSVRDYFQIIFGIFIVFFVFLIFFMLSLFSGNDCENILILCVSQ